MQDVNSTNSTQNQTTMTALFRRINPAQKFRITKHQTHIPHLKVSHPYLFNLERVCEKIS
jgi:hypothetical protein